MKPMNIISACNSNSLCIVNTELTTEYYMKDYENDTLNEFINLLKANGADSKCFSGYFLGYTIPQISKEFDLLRFCESRIINIELKKTLKDDVKLDKLMKQMNQNRFYLNFSGKEIQIFTYIENDGLYTMDYDLNEVTKIDVNVLIDILNYSKPDYNLYPDNLFVPRNYLISPFNNTEKFLKGEYFLTDHQSNIKREIIDNISNSCYKIYCIPANAGTGKTLLAYDIACQILSDGLEVLIVHCGKLNEGHLRLIDEGWDISSVRRIKSAYVDDWGRKMYRIIIVDESHRISEIQLDMIINKSIELNILVVFMYDINQYLRNSETKDIHEYIKRNYPLISSVSRRLTNKIRTNKELASFIKNLIHIGSSRTNLDYKDITIEYFNCYEDVEDYIHNLCDHHEWKAITFTTSMYNKEPLDRISNICESNAHDVIGQEFRKVVFVMDSNFRYSDDGSLMVRQTYYSAKGMLYQIVTRVVEELKIVVLDNPELFEDLLGIKHKSFMS